MLARPVGLCVRDMGIRYLKNWRYVIQDTLLRTWQNDACTCNAWSGDAWRCASRPVKFKEGSSLKSIGQCTCMHASANCASNVHALREQHAHMRKCAHTQKRCASRPVIFEHENPLVNARACMHHQTAL